MIHCDFERGFIRAETVAYDDYIKYMGGAGACDAGRYGTSENPMPSPSIAAPAGEHDGAPVDGSRAAGGLS